MTSKNLRNAIWLVLAASLAVSGGAFAKGPGSGGGGGGGGGGSVEAAGNNLSFPVIFAEGVVPGGYVEVLKGFADLTGDVTSSAFCAQETNTTVPLPTNILCYRGRQNLGISEETGQRIWVGDPCPSEDCRVWWLQERTQNKWQAFDPKHDIVNGGKVIVTAVDWGDLLESGALNTRQIRTEITLFKDVSTDPVYSNKIAFDVSVPCDVTIDPEACFATYRMSGAVPGTDQSINEIQGNDFGPGTGAYVGTQTMLNPVAVKGYHATVYSSCARLIIQKVTSPTNLSWDSSVGYWVNGAGAPVLTLTAYGGTYKAEVNAGGSLIYGYNWNAKNVVPGAYRLTYVLDGWTNDGGRCPNPLNAEFDESTTIINTGEVAAGVVLSQGDLMTAGGTGVEGGAAYVDITIKAKGGGSPRPPKK